MLLRELKVNNIGPFQGEQTVAFASDPERPVTLIGGKNGSGKTTLLESILVALYGSRSRGLLGFTNYPEFLRELTHDSCSNGSISLVFDRREDGKDRCYTLVRRWKAPLLDPPKEIFTVTVDGEERTDLAASWPEYVEQILPESMAGLSIFDGERIEALADSATSTEALRASLYGLLGLDLAQRLQGDLADFRQRTLKEEAGARDSQESALSNIALASADEALSEARRVVEHAEEHLVETEIVIENANAELAAAKDGFAKSGGDLYTQRELILQDQAACEERLESANATALGLAASALPLQLVRPLLEMVSEVGSNTQELEEADLLLRSHKERDDRLLNLLVGTSGFGPRQIGSLEKVFFDDRQNYETTYLAPFPVPVETYRLAVDLRGEGGDLARLQLTETLNEIQSLDRDAESYRRSLDKVPSGAEIKRLHQTLAAAEIQDQIAKKAVDDANKKLHDANHQLESAQRAFERVATSVLESGSAGGRAARINREVQKANEVLRRFQVRVVEKNLQEIRSNVLQSLKTLYHKDSLIEDIHIDPETLRIELVQGGNSVRPDRLSAGERQLLATALLWGLSKTTGQRLPTIVDTPVARLDSTHRTHLVERYFPKASHQVVLLSTDEEIIGDYYTKLEPAIGQTYFLDYDNVGHRTQIKPGYFS
jgi:DNA sulfur modification protein DndD